jgi:hypothetical protein
MKNFIRYEKPEKVDISKRLDCIIVNCQAILREVEKEYSCRQDIEAWWQSIREVKNDLEQNHLFEAHKDNPYDR